MIIISNYEFFKKFFEYREQLWLSWVIMSNYAYNE